MLNAETVPLHAFLICKPKPLIHSFFKNKKMLLQFVGIIYLDIRNVLNNYKIIYIITVFTCQIYVLMCLLYLLIISF